MAGPCLPDSSAEPDSAESCGAPVRPDLRASTDERRGDHWLHL